MKFYRIYIELTNVCGLKCSFCPTKELPSQSMGLEFFDSIVSQARDYTKEIACHVMGDPMTLSDLDRYLDIIHRYDMKALLTTSGYYLKKQGFDRLFHPSIKQINISLNSFNKNDTSYSLEQYLQPILRLCDEKMLRDSEMFINLRLWNLDEKMSERDFNLKLFDYLSHHFDIELDLDTIHSDRVKSIRLDYKILLHFDHYFEWPSLSNPYYGDGSCQGLSSHIAILSSGKVVPCCLDSDGIIELGDLKVDRLDDILQSSRVFSIRDGFSRSVAVEKLCQHCSYKDRFL
ncbi:Molybdenum cofactor biosynthesis enzyme and related Fe-S oxidoreductases [hydrothermal vent metagenome]|uniref:Molybdenum cofactor biosynthesis enzyme and related Fe-S oxidoreductases n=1 Tax=hydrothermal vent metagenome TaxID=652676 RepID=A0A1W1CDG2_9ZZZZ